MLLNYMPHSFDVYKKEQFVNLEQTNPTTWIADGVEGDSIVSVPSQGSVRMSTSTQELGVDADGVPVYNTVYGELTGFPIEDLKEGDVVLVSLPVVSMMKASNHTLSAFVASPYNAVRLRSNTSQVLGCMGYTH
jgi:hypothetical protein